MEPLFGFVIAMVVGMTGAGGGPLTVLVLVLVCGLPTAVAVGTSMVFVTIVKLLSAPAYVLRRQFCAPTLARLLAGGIPGVVAGTLLLSGLDTPALEHVVLAAVGGTIAILAVANLWKLWRGSTLPQRDCSSRLPCVAMLIGVEVGFSSAGASALGGVALLSLTRLAPSVIVGTDLLFGLGLSAVGSGLNLALDNVNGRLAAQLLTGGVAGALTGPWLATRVPMRLLRAALSLVLSVSGAQLFWRGVAPLIG
jgi:uncharacterized membrane protein YfcA